jgi:hypothetical protein
MGEEGRIIRKREHLAEDLFVMVAKFDIQNSENRLMRLGKASSGDPFGGPQLHPSGGQLQSFVATEWELLHAGGSHQRQDGVPRSRAGERAGPTTGFQPGCTR